MYVFHILLKNKYAEQSLTIDYRSDGRTAVQKVPLSQASFFSW